VPFAYALGALMVNDDSDRWVRLCDRTTIFAWLFLTIGIGLGAIWAYAVLGWGGFWGWDPVENGSILSWFVGVALIHSFTMYRRRGTFKKWALMLTAITFFMVIAGTWITRSGLITSVHAFSETMDKPVVFVFGGLMVLSLLVMLGAVLYRWSNFTNKGYIKSLTSREAGYYFNNLFMTLAAWILFFMTTAAWWANKTLALTSYEAFARYMGILYLIVMALSPLLKWGKTGAAALWEHVKLPLLVTIVPFALLIWNWVVSLRPAYSAMIAQGGLVAENFQAFGPRWLYDATAVLGLFLVSFLIVNMLFVFIDGARNRAKATGKGFGASLAWIVTKARTQSGGLLVHIAVAVIVIGLVGSVMYVSEVKKTIPATPGATLEIADYTLTLKSTTQATATNGDITDVAHFTLKKGGKDLGTVSPSVVTRATTQQTTPHAVIKSGALKDLFIALDSHGHDTTGNVTENNGDTLTMDVRINPLIRFIWVGIVLMMLGTALADWPKKKAIGGSKA